MSLLPKDLSPAFCLLCRVFIHCSRFALEKGSLIRQKLSGYITNALDHAPSLVVFDDLDSIISSSSDLEGPVSSTSAIELTDFLIDIVDDYAVSQFPQIAK